jgi:cysteine desulfurase
VLINGDGPRAPHVTNQSWMGWRGPELCAALDLEGLAISSGAACSAGTAEPSAVIRAMLGEARAVAAIRMSLGETTTHDDIDAACAAFGRVLRRNAERLLS